MKLPQILEDYLTMRRNLGYKLHCAGTALATFVSFMALHDADIITTELALSWATCTVGKSADFRARFCSLLQGDRPTNRNTTNWTLT
jgi:integrase/recombinase XerD